MPQERQEKRIDELDVLGSISSNDQLVVESGGQAKRIYAHELLKGAKIAMTVVQDSDGFYINEISTVDDSPIQTWTGGSY